MADIKKTIHIKKLLLDMLTSLKILKSKPSFTPKSEYSVLDSNSIEFENGLIIKYGGVQGLGGTAGSTSAAGCQQRINFPTAFPHACFFVITGVSVGTTPTLNTYTSYTTSVDKNGFNATINGLSNTHAATATANNVYWSTGSITYLAIGN